MTDQSFSAEEFLVYTPDWNEVLPTRGITALQLLHNLVKKPKQFTARQIALFFRIARFRVTPEDVVRMIQNKGLPLPKPAPSPNSQLRPILRRRNKGKCPVKEPRDLERIASIVAEHGSVEVTSLTTPDHSRVVASVRKVAMYLACELTGFSLAEIGSYFGGLHHTTVYYSCGSVEANLSLRGTIDLLRQKFAQ